MTTVEFHFDFGSPNAYLAHQAIPRIEARAGVQFDYIPILLGGIFKETNNVSPAISLQGIKNKPEYGQIETSRFLATYGVEAYTMNLHFPVNTLQIMRQAIFAKTQDYFQAYVDAMYRCMWAESRKMDDPDVIKAALAESGLPVDEIMASAQDVNIKHGLIANTSASVQRGSFGSPTFYVNNEIFFGKESLREVEEEIIRLQGGS